MLVATAAVDDEAAVDIDAVEPSEEADEKRIGCGCSGGLDDDDDDGEGLGSMGR